MQSRWSLLGGFWGGRARIFPSAAHESPCGKRPPPGLSLRGKGLWADLLPHSLWGLGSTSGSCSPALNYFCNGAAAWDHLIRVCWQLRLEGTLSLLFSASTVQSRAPALGRWAPRWCRWVCAAAAEPLLQPRLVCHPRVWTWAQPGSGAGSRGVTARDVVWNQVPVACMDEMPVGLGAKPRSPLRRLPSPGGIVEAAVSGGGDYPAGLLHSAHGAVRSEFNVLKWFNVNLVIPADKCYSPTTPASSLFCS